MSRNWVQVAVARALDDASRELRLIRQRVGGVEAALDRIWDIVNGRFRPEPAPLPPPPLVADSLSPHQETSDGWKFVVRVEGREVPLLVPPKLGKLLEILAADDGDTPAKSLVDWKSSDYIRRKMRAGPDELSNHAITNLVYRLRKKMQEFGIPRSLIQRNKFGSRRFALPRRPIFAVTGSAAVV